MYNKKLILYLKKYFHLIHEHEQYDDAFLTQFSQQPATEMKEQEEEKKNYKKVSL
jgi:hypothetical protein